MSSFFHLTYNERRGVLGALILMASIIAFKVVNSNIDQSFIVKAQLDVESSIDSLESVAPVVVKFHYPKKHFKEKGKLTLKPKKLNANTARVIDWKEIGFPNNIAERIFKYIKLKDGIKETSDLIPVYGLKKEWLIQIQDSLYFNMPKIDIQIASENDLILIKGIGETYAKRIVRYRKELGGYLSINQLTEVYGIDSLMLNSFSDQVFCSLNKIVLLNVNSVGYNELSKHPYITKKEAMDILLLRSEKGSLAMSDLSNVFPGSKFKKIKKYIKW
jgi:DNA uptake protein ComE-like DNA-binding protein